MLLLYVFPHPALIFVTRPLVQEAKVEECGGS